MAADNQEAYETLSWILDNANGGFFIVTAPHSMQVRLAERYKTCRSAVFDYVGRTSWFSFAELAAWAGKNHEADFYFILNMQLALRDENEMLAFNMSRDMISKIDKSWIFFMTKDLENRLSTFAYDIYSFVMLKAHFLPEAEDGQEKLAPMAISVSPNISVARDALARYKDLEERLDGLPLEGTPDKQLLSAAITLSNIAKLYINCMEYDNALRLLDKARQIRERIHGPWHPDTGETYCTIGEVCIKEGEFFLALNWIRKATDVFTKALGREHPKTAVAYVKMASAFISQGTYPKAMELLEKALAIQKRAQGGDDPDISETYFEIALLYEMKNDHAKALEFYERDISIFKNVCGDKHHKIGIIYNNIANIYINQGDYDKAMEMYENALNICRTVFGDGHRLTAVVYNNIASVYYNQGDYAKAQEFYGIAFEIADKALGKSHQDTILFQKGLDRATHANNAAIEKLRQENHMDSWSQ